MIKVERLGLLESFAEMGIKPILSQFTYDMVIFIKPKRVELKVFMDMLERFGNATGLQVNLGKSSIIPIRCYIDQPGILCRPVLHAWILPLHVLGASLEPQKIEKG